MASLHYRSDDALPIALLVLTNAADHLRLIIFKFVLKDHYPELRGLVSTEESSKSSDQLVNELEDPFITMLRFMFSTIQLPILEITGVYGIDPETVVFSRRAWQLSDELFWGLIMGDFILDNEQQLEDSYDDEEYMHNLDIFIITLITIVDQLLILLDGGRVDIDEAMETYGLVVEFEKERFSDKPQAYAMGLLCDVGLALLDYQEKIRNEDYSVE